MQRAPYRLSQTIWSAFRAAKPGHRPQFCLVQPKRTPIRRWAAPAPRIALQTRFYGYNKSEIDKKADDAKARIEDALDARVEAALEPDTRIKHTQDETIVHTNPEASSIVYTTSPDDRPPKKPSALTPHPQGSQTDPLPSQKFTPDQLRARFASFMDNFQSHLFTASQRLNDLTGYSSIQTLKDSIAEQESLVQEGRKAVKYSRNQYAEAIKTRSQTQREVNDLLHRKHAWSPEDLEKFTRLYRSDHANEQQEQQAQSAVAEAEQAYEEASTTLAKSILARYHEEQIWSDKIRQMSTWGTWGLMGLNVLLFVVFQILIEPWRRKRLVKGFEEKVEIALKERDELITRGGAVLPNGAGAMAYAPNAPKKKDAEGLADHIAEQTVDAVAGSTASASISPQAAQEREQIEAAAEAVTDREIKAETSMAIDTGEYKGVFASQASGFAYYEEAFRELWSERQMVVTQKELTTVALEGAAGGAALMGLLVLLLRPK